MGVEFAQACRHFGIRVIVVAQGRRLLAEGERIIAGMDVLVATGHTRNFAETGLETVPGVELDPRGYVH